MRRQPCGRIFHGNTTAEDFYIIYPDGFTVRKVIGYPGTGEPREGQPYFWEVGEIIFIHPRGSSPRENLGKELFSTTNIAGNTFRAEHKPGLKGEQWRCQHHPASRTWSEFIWLAPLNGRPTPFVVIPNNQELYPHTPCMFCGGGDHPATLLRFRRPGQPGAEEESTGPSTAVSTTSAWEPPTPTWIDRRCTLVRLRAFPGPIPRPISTRLRIFPLTPHGARVGGDLVAALRRQSAG